MSSSEPFVIIIAGPNGAGKTTFARELLPREATCPVFVNADLIAATILHGSEPALRRAGKRARERAQWTSTRLVVCRGGVVRYIDVGRLHIAASDVRYGDKE